MEKMYRVKFLRRDPFTDKIMSDTVQTIRTKSLTKAIEEYKWLSKATKEFKSLSSEKGFLFCWELTEKYGLRLEYHK